MEDRYDEVLTDDALALVGRLHEELDGAGASCWRRDSTSSRA